MRIRTSAIVAAALLAAGIGYSVWAQGDAGTPAAAPAAAPAVSAPAAGAPPEGAASLKVEHQRTMWDLIRSGGWAMYPLGICSMITVWLAILNLQRVNLSKMVPKSVIAQLKAAAAAGDLQQLWTVATTTDSFFTRSIAAGLRQVQPDDPTGSRPKVEAAIMETAIREEANYAFFVNFLALMTSMAPLWGLIGTVSGMIGAFGKIGGSGAMGKPEILAKNISEALVCTASGLLIAITAMAFYFLFRNILNTVMKVSEGYFTEILDTLMGMENTLAHAVAQAAPAAPAPAAEQPK